MKQILPKRMAIITLILITLVCSASVIAYISYRQANEFRPHSTLYLQGKDNADATKSGYVATFLGWLKNFTGHNLEVIDSEGKVAFKEEVNPTPPSPCLRELLRAICTGGDTVVVKLDKKNPYIFFDTFTGWEQWVDLEDLNWLPDPPPYESQSNSFDKAQMIAHALGEVYYLARNRNRFTFVQEALLESHRKGGLPEEWKVRYYDTNGAGRMLIPNGVSDDVNMDRNTTHWMLHWYGPPDGQGLKWEVYREYFKMDNQAGSGNIIEVTRGIQPPDQPYSVQDPVAGEVLVFKGSVYYVDEPKHKIWSGRVENYQGVAYKVISVIQGSYSEQYIKVFHAIIYKSPDSDPTLPRLSSGIFYLGKELIVNATYTFIGYATARPVSIPTPPGVGGIIVPFDKFALLAPYIGLTSTIIVATAATAIYIKRVKHRKEKQ